MNEIPRFIIFYIYYTWEKNILQVKEKILLKR